jgi:hypothetical protein
MPEPTGGTALRHFDASDIPMDSAALVVQSALVTGS